MNELLNELKSLDDVLKVLDTVCPNCEEVFGWDSKYDKVSRKYDVARFECTHSHVRKLKIDFVTQKSDVDNLMVDFRKFMQANKQLPADKQGYYKTFEAYQKKLQIYATFASKNQTLEFEGYCFHCGAEVPVSMKEGRVWYACPPCAMMVADSAD